MSTPQQEDRITLKQLVDRLLDFVKHILSRLVFIVIVTVVVTVLVLGYNYLRKPTYSARTSFVLESDNSSGLGQLSSFASLAGINLGSLSESSDLFQIDNIQELYRSHRMLEKTLLTPIDHSDHELMIDYFGEVEDLTDRWVRKMGYQGVEFGGPRENLTRAQDSVLIEAVKVIRKDYLIISKPSRKLSILEVIVNHKDEDFAKAFNETLVENVNDFYIKTKTRKASQNLKLVQHQADSVKRALDEAMDRLAAVSEELPNANPLLATNQLPRQRALLDVTTSGEAYAEIVKNLEVAKISLRDRTPLIQVIDSPLLPLPHNIWKLMKALILGIGLGGFLAVTYVGGRYILVQALKEE